MDRRAELLKLHATLCSAIEQAEARELAPLVREMRAVLAELDALPVADAPASPVDEVALARDARRRQAAGS